MPFQKNRTISYTAIIFTMAIWGVATPVIRGTIEYIPPMTYLMVRFVLSSLLLSPIIIHYFKKYHLNRERVKKIIISSFSGHILGIGLVFIALEKTTAIEGSVMTSIAPLITAFLAYVILKETINRKKIQGTLIAFFGALIIIFTPIINGESIFNGGRTALIGNIIYIFGLLFDSFYTIYVKKNLTNDKIISPMMQIAFSFLIAAIVFIPLSILEQYRYYERSDPYIKLRTCQIADFDIDEYSDDVRCEYRICEEKVSNSDNFVPVCKVKDTDPSFTSFFVLNLIGYFKYPSLFGILYMAVLSGILAYTLYSKGLKYVGASEASLLYYLQPIFGIPIAVVFLNEKISIAFITGAIVIAIGIFIAEKAKTSPVSRKA